MVQIKNLLLILFAGLIFSCTKPIDFDKTAAREFFTQLERLHHWNKTVFLIDGVCYDKKRFQKIISNESLLSNEDVSYINQQLLSSSYKVWGKDIFDTFEIVNKRYIDSVGKPDPFTQTPSYLRFSKPYFTRDGKYCFIYYSFYCGNLCAESSFQLFTKTNGKWTFVESYFTIVS